jgi:hypothetical protein
MVPSPNMPTRPAASLTLALCQRATDCAGPTWAEAVQPFSALQYAVSDGGGGGGLRAGLRAVQRQRPALAPEPAAATARPLELGRDVFPISLDAQPQLRRRWRPVEQAWQRAEQADAVLARTKRQRSDAKAAAAQARQTWVRVAQTLAAYEAVETAWRRAQAALRVFRPEGRLNDPQSARAELVAACAALPGESWAAVRRARRDERTLTPLRRLPRRLGTAANGPPDAPRETQARTVNRRTCGVRQCPVPHGEGATLRPREVVPGPAREASVGGMGNLGKKGNQGASGLPGSWGRDRELRGRPRGP